MKSFNCGKGWLIFSTAFVIGLFFTLFFESTETPRLVSSVQPISKSSEPAKLNCREKTEKDNEIHRLLRERLDLETEIAMWQVKAENKKQLKIYQKRLKEINQQLAKIEKEIRAGKYKQIESEATHNLLFVESCVEY